jgi:hypothetical protein
MHCQRPIFVKDPHLIRNLTHAKIDIADEGHDKLVKLHEMM